MYEFSWIIAGVKVACEVLQCTVEDRGMARAIVNGHEQQNSMKQHNYKQALTTTCSLFFYPRAVTKLGYNES